MQNVREFEKAACEAVALALAPLAPAIGSGVLFAAPVAPVAPVALAEEDAAAAAPVAWGREFRGQATAAVWAFLLALYGAATGLLYRKAASKVVAPSKAVLSVLRGISTDSLLAAVSDPTGSRTVADILAAAATATYNSQDASYANGTVLAAYELARRYSPRAKLGITALDCAVAAVAAGWINAYGRNNPAKAWSLAKRLDQLVGYCVSAAKRGLLRLVD